jgi:Na+-translocating ferredoxin:NAD+ oxidoreductase RnfE subunit
MSSRAQRRNFARGMALGLGIIWPVLSVLVSLIAGLGMVIGRIEKWSLLDSIYFAFVSGLTIGYGDLAPKTALTRILAIVIGVCGVLLTGLIAAVAVKALTAVTDNDERNRKL